MPPPISRIHFVAVNLFAIIYALSPCASSQEVLTVKEAEFRSRWSGPLEDRTTTPQFFEPGGGLSEEEKSSLLDDEPSLTSGFASNVDRMAENLKRGLRFGPLDLSLGLATGWEYSSQNSGGAATDFANNNSFFAAPTLGVVYDREIGVWRIASRFGAGYRYFYNQEYTAAGSGLQRNPLSLTGGFIIGYTTSRLSIDLNSSASSGSGYDIITGTNNWQTSASTSLSIRYILTEQASIGAAGSISYSRSADTQSPAAEVAQPDSNNLTTSVSTFADYLVTPKTNTRLLVSAGQELQSFESGMTEGRQYIDTMLQLTYQLAPKFSVDAGGGGGYVSDKNIADSKYTGWRPVYTAGINYTPTEKTYFKATFGMQGADIRPNFSLAAGWNAREKTRLSLSLYQNQGFSSLAPNQYNITRGILGTVAQKLFKGIDLSLSGGYEQSDFASLTSDSLSSASDGPADYFLTSATISWRIREWLGWQNTFMLSTGQGNQNQIQTRISTSLNLTF
jgi:hypothetical protein